MSLNRALLAVSICLLILLPLLCSALNQLHKVLYFLMGFIPYYTLSCSRVQDKPLILRMRDGLNEEGRVVEPSCNKWDEHLILRSPIGVNELLERKLPEGLSGIPTNIRI